MKERNISIDFIKGISILLMVVAHSCPPILFRDMIYLFHIGLFYYASGWLFKEDYLQSPLLFAKRKLKGLYIPYVKWGVLYFFLVNIVSFLLYDKINQDLGSLADILLFRRVHLLISPLWFLKSLFISEVVFFCILYLFKNKIAILLLVFLFIYTVGWYCSNKSIKLPMGINRELVTMFVLFLGYFCNKHKCNDLVKHNSKVDALLLLGCLVILLVGTFLEIKIDTMSCTFSYWLIYPFYTIIGVEFLLCVNSLLSRIVNNQTNLLYKLIYLLSKSSLSILALHFTCFMLLSIVLKYCGVNQELNLSNGFVYSSKYWWLYSIVGVLCPLAIVQIYGIILNKIKCHSKISSQNIK